jgi:hypothetical protein
VGAERGAESDGLAIISDSDPCHSSLLNVVLHD